MSINICAQYEAPPVDVVEAGLPRTSPPRPIIMVNSIDVDVLEAGLPRAPPPRPGFATEIIMVNSIDSLYIATACIRARIKESKLIAVDLEGVDLSAEGTICIVQIATSLDAPVYLFDIVALGMTAFSDEALKGLLEDGDIQKILFDVRADANALSHLFKVKMENVIDLQLVDAAYSRLNGKDDDRVHGLGWLLTKTQRANLSDTEKVHMKELKDNMKAIYDTNNRIWEGRPLSPTLLEYCTDAIYFFPMYESYTNELYKKFRSAPWLDAVLQSTLDRIEWAHSDSFNRMDKDRLIRIPDKLTDRLKIFARHSNNYRSRQTGGKWTQPKG